MTLLLPLAPAVGQWLPDHQVDPVVVTVDRYPGPLTQTARTVTVLQRAEIERLNARSLTNLLQAVPGVMLQKRGSGIQTDVSVRGGSFSETLILLDGVPVNDPQTGHHNLNLPVSIQDIQRIEVLHGPGSDVYGADAVSGVVHIVTRETKPGGSVQVRGGEHGLVGSSMALRTQTGRIRHSLSANYEQSDGFTRNTDYECLNVSWKSTFKQGDTRLSLYSGVSDKQFGANSFYSQQFPDQYEQTRAWLSSLRLSTTVPADARIRSFITVSIMMIFCSTGSVRTGTGTGIPAKAMDFHCLFTSRRPADLPL
ncbi:MAG: TonB-dependent receptor plug domain-containing protein [candidate division KSB1 bacterium]|nr:TonB-dependent receptor plug domain-containing protein [candidate division KSB1 bacterium]